ncbi:MAG: serine/threonine protein kinase [Kaiparowitsia implicata GSE-PSE-MK54-09C]|jgi:serine/threonine-protein kinase|nr:serine/threonine protein kinase [Kaiparowitsia implicata GSE-PSE-MK54-09C]
MTDPNIGRVLIDRYQLVELLGQGAMGRVYGAKDILLGGVPVAIKFLAQTLLNQRMRDRFEREATTCAQLGQRSIHIVRVTDYGVDENEVPFYVMEHLKGHGLGELIMQQPLKLPKFLNFSRQIGLGLQTAHQGIIIDGKVCPIVHRDIKPSNIMVCRDDSLGELAKVLDFGIAKTMQENDANQTNCFMGTLAYASPEQMEGQELDARSDIYSMGVMMFQMLTGRMPLNAETHTFGGWYKAHHHHSPRTLVEANPAVKVPKALETLVMGCLAKHPGDRPQAISEVLKALEPFDQRFGSGREIGRRIGDVLSKVPIIEPPSTPSVVMPEDVFRLATWPSNQPIGEICFPNAIRTSQGMLATLWVMLSRQDVQKRKTCTRYNQFLFTPSPHPTLAWLTVLYNPKHGARWLPSYLDLKTSQGQKIARLLSETGQYHVMMFAKEDPGKCSDVLTVPIDPAMCTLLKDWVTAGQMAPSVAQFSVSRSLLKTEIDTLKPKILQKLEAGF